ncbi:MAG TPA: GNAT family N-acetyltransferase [Vicinamibacterales bacterium]|nr:GNAT family N-acetyltransferase [Vicinamibacterales bacterium]
MKARRTYLEMRDATRLSPARTPPVQVDIAREYACLPSTYRDLYLGVGAAYHWTDRAAWTDEQIAAHLGQPSISIFIARVTGVVAGFFELREREEGSVEIAYFGLMPEFVGQGLGGHLLTAAAREAWQLKPTLVWVHTSTLDHGAALTNYLRRGFEIARTEEYEVS